MKENEHYDQEQSYSRTKDIEQLETLVFHFTQLSKRLSHDREHWAETGKDLSNIVEELNKTGQQFLALEQRFKEQVATIMKQEAQAAAANMVRAFGAATEQVLAQQITITASQLDKAVQQTSNVLADYQQEISQLKTWFLIGLIAGSLLGNILAGVIIYYILLT